MYEYAAIAMGPRRCGANLMVVKIAVGPSAPPMIASEAASGSVKKLHATISTANIPNCAPAPKMASLRFLSIGPKSVKAPTPMKMMGGRKPVLMRA